MKTWKILGYLGLIPFVLCLLFNTYQTFWAISTKEIFIAYSAVILSFMAGTLWRIDAKVDYKNQQIVSNVFSLIAFVALLVPFKLSIGVLGTSYLFIFLYENLCIDKTERNNPDANYSKMRFWLTSIVILFHISAFMIWNG